MGESAGSDPKRTLTRLLANRREVAALVELVWPQAERGFPGPTMAAWLDACASLDRSPLGPICTLAYLRDAPACAALVGAEAAIALGHAAELVGARAGGRAALALLVAAPRAARRLADGQGFREWLRIIGQLAELAPESVALLLDRIDLVLGALDLRGFEAWALGGVRSAGGDVERRRDLLALQEPRPQDGRARGDAGEVAFPSVERPLLAYVQALWRLRPPVRGAAATGAETPRRASFESGIIRMPEVFRGFAGAQAVALFRAALAHVAAHLVFTPGKFAVGGLKPVQIALVSLIEDARVEQLAMRQFPGLRRLWQPFHVAESSGVAAAPLLMARLARALIDPEYADDNGWVRKGRDLFLAEEARWCDPGISRAIGSLLGNDLGQMRAQFNARTYVVEPPYRDDNLGLWDFGQAADATAAAELVHEAVRSEQVEDDERPPDRERETPAEEQETPNRAAPAQEADEEAGIPVARYGEWDYAIGRERPDWTTVVEFPVDPGDGRAINRILDRHPLVVNRLTALIRAAKVGRPVRLRRQPEGERLDLDACIAAAVSKRHGEAPDPRVYATLARKHRDLSVLVLLDVSQSTNDFVSGSGRSVLALEREATALLAHAMAGLGDPFAIHAFCSDGRDEVRYHRVKDFDAPYGAAAKARLAGLTGQLSTRMGAALRHAGRDLARRLTDRRLLLVVTDGEPSDIDVGDPRYLVEDARKAVQALAHAGIDVFGVGLGAGGESYLTRIFGRRNVVRIDRIERLPEKLPMLYLRLTA
jgi:uncharacterized protein with von Willebrand factor type A (vWA) domain